jgi:hypothetical protein
MPLVNPGFICLLLSDFRWPVSGTAKVLLHDFAHRAMAHPGMLSDIGSLPLHNISILPRQGARCVTNWHQRHSTKRVMEVQQV